MKKWISNFMIVAGLVLLIALVLGMKHSKEEQLGLIEAFETVKTEASNELPLQNEAFGITAEAAELPDGVEAVLAIPAIELKSPVLAGASPANLDKALGSIEGLDEPGKMDGSYAIAGHQAHVFGKFFNRLDELESGDRFTLETINEEMAFEVFDIQIVKPEQVEVLKPKKGMSMVSLITCYPENSNEFRLIVQAKKVE
ncbi:class D sortase [Planococcus ruber]|uniref:class D sortase n=1 Tax=Planococcus ruber TaxID=2027871 RepID=UPI001FEE30F0|nr:class D sortase [Planococcus ruber]MCJ1907845.1 class D sortase [Planococcus ruber]